jgi:hypothetical protein
LLQRGLPVLLRIEPVEVHQGELGALVAHVIGQGDEIEVISHSVAPENQRALYAKNFGFCRQSDRSALERNGRGFQGFAADELAYSRLDSVQSTQDHHGAPDTRRFPSGDGLQLRQDFVEMGARINKDVIGVLRETVACM